MIGENDVAQVERVLPLLQSGFTLDEATTVINSAASYTKALIRLSSMLQPQFEIKNEYMNIFFLFAISI